MHAIRQYEPGGPEVLRHEQVADLEAAAGQVRVAVRACGVHVLDTRIRSGDLPRALPSPQLPMTPGREVAGVVDRIGPEVDAGWLGRRVVAHLGQASGGYAEQAVVAVSSVHEIPDGLSFDVAVAAIGTGRTATGILDLAPIRPDDVVIVTAAGGGLGVLLIQAAHEAGATVIGLAGRADKVATALEQGADAAVDYMRDGWPDALRNELGGRAPTLVFDAVGGAEARTAYELLARGGRIVQYGWFTDESPTYDDPDKITVEVLGPTMMARPGGLRSLEAEAIERAADGSRVPLVGSTFALPDAADAHRAIEARTTLGKVVLIPGATP